MLQFYVLNTINAILTYFIWTVTFYRGIIKKLRPRYGEMQMNKPIIAKVTLSSEADTMLNKMLDTANHDFLGGRITKHDLLSWIVLRYEQSWFSKSLEQLRAHHFDDFAYLENLVKKAKEARRDKHSDFDLQSALNELSTSSRKKNSKAQTGDLDGTTEVGPLEDSDRGNFHSAAQGKVRRKNEKTGGDHSSLPLLD